MTRPLAIDLFTGLHGWAQGLVAEGFEVVGFDLEDMCRQFGQPRPEHVHLVVQDVLTLHGSQFRDAALIVASPPCQEFSWMAMPWSRAKQVAAALRGEGEFPDNYHGSRTVAELTALFDACFRIQREASAAAGRYIPMVIENVRGAQPWVGRSRWAFGSFHLWGDVPALMPITMRGQVMKTGDVGWRERGPGRQLQDKAIKNTGGSWFNIAHNTTSGKDGRKLNDADGYERDHPNAFGWKAQRTSSGATARKAASAMIAKIPEALARHIARTYHPDRQAGTA